MPRIELGEKWGSRKAWSWVVPPLSSLRSALSTGLPCAKEAPPQAPRERQPELAPRDREGERALLVK